MVYLADHPALAQLEVIVHLGLSRDTHPRDYVLIQVSVPETVKWQEAEVGNEQVKGDAFLERREAALLRVPSILTPHCYNWLLNPAHSHANQITITNVDKIDLDQRFFG